MEPINLVVRNTGKKCSAGSCTGDIVEKFKVKLGEFNGIYGPGAYAPSWTASDGFACNLCGICYGEPIFQNTKPTSQIEFELTLEEAVLVKEITLNDIPDSHNYLYLESFKKEVEKILPEDLKNLKPGSTVYCLPSREQIFELRKQTIWIKLSKEKEARAFEILRDSNCIA